MLRNSVAVFEVWWARGNGTRQLFFSPIAWQAGRRVAVLEDFSSAASPAWNLWLPWPLPGAVLQPARLTLSTQLSRLNSTHALAWIPHPPQDLHPACGWTRHATSSFHIGHWCLDKGNVVVSENLEMPTTVEPQGVLQLSHRVSWDLSINKCYTSLLFLPHTAWRVPMAKKNKAHRHWIVSRAKKNFIEWQRKALRGEGTKEQVAQFVTGDLKVGRPLWDWVLGFYGFWMRECMLIGPWVNWEKHQLLG